MYSLLSDSLLIFVALAILLAPMTLALAECPSPLWRGSWRGQSRWPCE
jgi:hypothetical protein